MSDRSKIEWTDASWNPIKARNRATGKVGWFCMHKSPGCKNCYAEPMNRRLGTGVDYKAQNRDQVEIFAERHALMHPLRWRKPRGVFVCSMSDLFGEFVTDHMIDQVFAVMALCPQHTFFVLTKRADRMRAYIQAVTLERIAESVPVGAWLVSKAEAVARITGNSAASLYRATRPAWPLPHVWLGVSCEDQATANERIPHLLDTPAAVRWVSAEPLLGPINFDRGRWLEDFETDDNGPVHHGLDWIVVGGESGSGARPMHPSWPEAIRDQCASADVAFFFKQWGAWSPADGVNTGALRARWIASDGQEHSQPMDCDTLMHCVGKKEAGRLLAGREHNARPPLAHEITRSAT